MTDYNKSVNFAVKDTLTSGDPNKIVSGAEIDTEFNNISSASSTKADKVSAATTDNLASLDSSGNLKDSGVNAVSVAPPVGSITMYAASVAPSGWLECDGSNVNRATYPNLFDAIGTTFGAGDGSTTFGLPDLRGEFVRGWDNNRGVDSGRSFGSSQQDAFQGHHHHLDRAGFGALSGSQEAGTAALSETGTVNDPNPRALDPRSDGVNGSPRTASETRPRNIALMYIIKT